MSSGIDFLAPIDMKGQQGTSLPTAGAEWRGRLFLKLGGSGEEDRMYVCLKDDSDNYEWLDITAVFVGL